MSAPIEAAANPLPRDDTTPPVMKINLVFIVSPELLTYETDANNLRPGFYTSEA
jgi:hypothetical protein